MKKKEEEKKLSANASLEGMVTPDTKDEYDNTVSGAEEGVSEQMTCN